MSQLKNKNYQQILNVLKDKIRTARIKASLTVNAQLLAIYWEIGKTILEQQQSQGWGAKIIDQLAIDLKMEFSDMSGFSVRNLKYMRAFVDAYPDFVIVQPVVAQLQNAENQSNTILQPVAAKLSENIYEDTESQFVQPMVAQIPWTHHTIILDKIRDRDERIFYIKKTIENGWSKSVLKLQIESNLYNRQGNAITNFETTMPAYESDLAKETFKSPYILDLMMLADEAKEKDLERALVQHLKIFLRELGRGFAYVGNQFNLKVEDDEYFLDLLFYNINLHCYVIIELKIGDFKPEYTGKLNFYINTVNEKIKGKADNQTIGILLCKTPNKTVVKYALEGIKTPMGVAEYEFTKALPKQLKGEIPTIEELETEIEKEYEELKTPTQKKLDALKQKIAGLKKEELQKEATIEILRELHQMGIKPLFEKLLNRLEEVKTHFMSVEHKWQGNGNNTDKFEDFDLVWCPDSISNYHEFKFYYRFIGFRKSGTEAFDIYINIDYLVDKFWYGFRTSGRLNDKMFFKKTYNQLPTKEDIDCICDYIIENAIADIEQKIEYLENNNT